MNKDLPCRLFLDMDGTLVAWKDAEKSTLLQAGYFLNLAQNQNMVRAAALIHLHHKSIELFSLSACLPESRYAAQEKRLWMKQHCPFIPESHYLFCPTTANKADFVPGGIRATDVLIDDLSANLHSWALHAKGLKLMNGINGTKGSWTGPRIFLADPPEVLVDQIVAICHGTQEVA